MQLGRSGHELSISDISTGEVELAEQKAAERSVHFQASKAFDARNLNEHPEIYKENYYDIELLLGPFNHILQQPERESLLRTALKILRGGGYLFAAFVTRNARLRDIAVKDPRRLRSEADFYKQYLRDGIYTRDNAAPMHHTTVREIR